MSVLGWPVAVECGGSGLTHAPDEAFAMSPVQHSPCRLSASAAPTAQKRSLQLTASRSRQGLTPTVSGSLGTGTEEAGSRLAPSSVSGRRADSAALSEDCLVRGAPYNPKTLMLPSPSFEKVCSQQARAALS